VVARLLYGFRVSVLFGLALTITGVLLGLLTGAVQGYFAGKTDLFFQRFMEIWGSMPELYLLIIFASIFQPSIGLLLAVAVAVRLDGFVRLRAGRFPAQSQSGICAGCARAWDCRTGKIIWRHVLPNSLTPVVTFLPFRMSAAILALTSLDFLGLGVPPSSGQSGRTAGAGQKQSRRMVDRRFHFLRADRDACCC
jgi:microcin C transport system permease protein